VFDAHVRGDRWRAFVVAATIGAENMIAVFGALMPAVTRAAVALAAFEQQHREIRRILESRRPVAEGELGPVLLDADTYARLWGDV
jgi:hypothetical protein